MTLYDPEQIYWVCFFALLGIATVINLMMWGTYRQNNPNRSPFKAYGLFEITSWYRHHRPDSALPYLYWICFGAWLLLILLSYFFK